MASTAARGFRARDFGPTAFGARERWRDDDADDELESAWSAWSRTVDHWTIGACMALFAIGVVLVFAASPALAENNRLPSFYYAWRHMAYGVPAFAALFVLSFFSLRGVRRVGVLLAVGGVAALALLPFHGMHHDKGAMAWFSIGGLSVQPAEIAKPGVVIVCAWLLAALRERDRAVRLGGLWGSVAMLGLMVALLVIQPDYGQTALVIAAWSAMYIAAGGSAPLVGAVALGAVAIGWVGYHVEPHIASRLNVFFGVGGHDQLEVAAQAVANGGWFGVGLGEGVAKTELPDAHSDFILAVAAEEYGFALVAVIISLFTLLPLRALWLLNAAEHPFAHIAGVGLAAMFGLQALIHIAVTAQIAPATGVTLPFISYGGSSMVSTGVTIGLLLALARRRGLHE